MSATRVSTSKQGELTLHVTFGGTAEVMHYIRFALQDRLLAASGRLALKRYFPELTDKDRRVIGTELKDDIRRPVLSACGTAVMAKFDDS